MERRRKCLIGVVAFQGVDYKVLQNYMAWAFHLGRRVDNWDFYLRVIGKKEQFRARNNLIDMAKNWLHHDDDILLMLDDDMILPQETFERLVTILDSYPDAGVVSGLYWQRGGAYRPVIQKLAKRHDGYALDWYAPYEITGEVMQVGITGGGVLMFPMRAIKTLINPVFWVDGIVGTDIWVCTRLNQAGWKVYCDTGLEFGHLDEGRVITEKNLPSHFKRYGEFCKNLEEAACEYLKMDRNTLESYQNANLWALEENWCSKPRDTFDAVADAYREIGEINVARNTYYAIHSNMGVEGFADIYDAIERGMLKKSAPALDYGCGVGVATEILAMNGWNVEAYDLAGTDVLKFLEWRMKKRKINRKIKIMPVTSSKPQFSDKYSMVIMLDVIEHLINPHEILEDILPRIMIGGHFHTNFHVMDFKGADEGVHQHLKNITLNEFDEIMKKHKMVPVGTFLWTKLRR